MAVFGRRAHEKFLERCKEPVHRIQVRLERLSELLGDLLFFDSFPEVGISLSEWCQIQFHTSTSYGDAIQTMPRKAGLAAEAEQVPRTKSCADASHPPDQEPGQGANV